VTKDLCVGFVAYTAVFMKSLSSGIVPESKPSMKPT
jgi:hypothetical protein